MSISCKTVNGKAHTTYDKWTRRQLYVFYSCNILFWVVLVIFLGLHRFGAIGLIILSIPVFVFSLALMQIAVMSVELEGEIHKANFLSLGMIVALSLFGLLEKSYTGDKKQFSSVVLVAIVMSLLSLIHIWTAPIYIPLTRHFKSALQTMAATLLVFALYMYFVNSEHTTA
jgi:hypothetical protein